MNVEVERMKSSLIQQRGQQEQEQEQEEYEISVDQSTVGIDIQSLNLPSLPKAVTTIPSTKSSSIFTSSSSSIDEETSVSDSTSNPMVIKYVVWDFAGQIEYSTLHPVSILYCSDLYLLTQMQTIINTIIFILVEDRFVLLFLLSKIIIRISFL